MARGPAAWLGLYPRLVDVLLAVVVFFAALVGAPPTPEQLVISFPSATPGVVVLLAVASLLLLARRRRPLAVWAATLVLTLLSVPVTGEAGRGLPVTVVALYAVARYVDRRAAVGAGLVTMLVAGLSVGVRAEFGFTSPVTYAVVAWCGLAAALGDAVRSNRQVIADAEERARVAELTRDEEALRRVAEERLRLSRELHDVIGHHLAVVNVQAGVAQHLLRSNPARAEEALDHVRTATSEALAQTGQLVGLLRTGEAPTEPAPGLEQLPALIDATRAAGAQVAWTHRGPRVDIAGAHSLQAYRLVQEALTNAVRHGTGEVQLTTTQDDDLLTIEVRNPLPDAPRDMGGRQRVGHGLIGMHERVALTGGTMSAARTADGYRVNVQLPVKAPTS